MRSARTALKELGIKWLFHARDIYIHKSMGKVTLLKIIGNRAEVQCHEDGGKRLVVLPLFSKGIKSQVRVGKEKDTSRLFHWRKESFRKVLTLGGRRVVLKIARVVYAPITINADAA